MLIVTPVFGSMPEPRPQQLITGDRAILLLDDASSAALQNAGVKVATISLGSYNKLVTTLVPETFQGLDANGQLLPAYMPPYASQSAIAALNLLGIDGTVQTKYLPSYLTTSGLASLLGGANSTVIQTDPDGTPVILGGPVSEQNISVAGTATIGTMNAGQASADTFTSTISTLTAMETTQAIFDNQSVTPGTPGGNSVKVFSNSSGRLSFLDPAGQTYLIGNKRVVTTLPTTGMQVGDEVFIAATGEHRIYKGSALGWRLASPLEVPGIPERTALANPYPGMKVYVTASGQEHVYGSDSKWHGTRAVHFLGGNPINTNQINDTNYRTWNTTDIADPGYPYYVQGRTAIEVSNLGPAMRVEVKHSIGDYGTGNNPFTMDTWYQDNVRYNRAHIPVMLLIPQTGAKRIIVSYRFYNNNANGYSGNFICYNDYLLIPV